MICVGCLMLWSLWIKISLMLLKDISENISLQIELSAHTYTTTPIDTRAEKKLGPNPFLSVIHWGYMGHDRRATSWLIHGFVSPWYEDMKLKWLGFICSTRHWSHNFQAKSEKIVLKLWSTDVTYNPFIYQKFMKIFRRLIGFTFPMSHSKFPI